MPELYPILEQGEATRNKVVGQTKQTFRYKNENDHLSLQAVLLDVVKAGPGEYIGWVQQGGTGLMKTPTYMNYFNEFSDIVRYSLANRVQDMDNMMYKQVYQQGPLDGRERM